MDEVIVADPNFAPMYATLTRRIKTDPELQTIPVLMLSSRPSSRDVASDSACNARNAMKCPTRSATLSTCP